MLTNQIIRVPLSVGHLLEQAPHSPLHRLFASPDDEVSDVFRIAQWSVGVFSIWFVLSGSFCLFVILSLVILLPLVSTAELRLDDFLVDELCGRSLYIGGVDHLGERTKHNHFYLFSGSLPLREYHRASRYLKGSA
jgi:hypothetical protein